MVMVRVDGAWLPGHVIAQEQRDDGDWNVHVQYRVDDANYFGTFTGDDVRPDDTDYSRGRRA